MKWRDRGHPLVWRFEMAILRAQMSEDNSPNASPPSFARRNATKLPAQSCGLQTDPYKKTRPRTDTVSMGPAAPSNRKIQGSLLKSDGTRDCRARMLGGYFFATSNGYSSASAGHAEIKEL
jgi:hypothetical protein